MDCAVLVVDDDRLVGPLLVRYLQRYFRWCEASLASTLDEFITMLKARTYSLVLSDAHLRPGTYLDILRVVQEIAPRCPVVVVTGDLDQTQVQRALDWGAAAVTPKTGIGSDELARAITPFLPRSNSEP
jgi:DNA-binding NarL/FixJ family response regulator